MKLACIAAFLAVACLPVLASVSDKYGIETPPRAYDHIPRQPTLQLELPATVVNQICDPMAIGVIFYGCIRLERYQVEALTHDRLLSESTKLMIGVEYIHHPDVCVIIVPKVDAVISSGMQASVIRHEHAHCNGLYHNLPSGHGWQLANGTLVEDHK